MTPTVVAAPLLKDHLVHLLQNQGIAKAHVAPFRLVRVEIPETREGLVRIALIRREELDGFVEGLFGKEQSLELPERAQRALDVLS
jgi:hypothetical protein